MVKLAECPRCDGYGDHGVEEESGCLYVCYCCGGSGRLDADVAASMRADEAWSAYLMQERMVIEAARAAPRRAARPLAPPSAWPLRPVAAGSEEWDDIPF